MMTSCGQGKACVLSRPPWKLRWRGGVAFFLTVLAAAAIPHAPSQGGELTGHGGAIRALSVAADGLTLITGSFDTTVRYWDVAALRQVAELRVHSHAVNAVTMVPDGLYAASGDDQGNVLLWDLRGNRVIPLPRHGVRVAAIAASADGRLIASAGWDRLIRVVAVPSAAEVARFEHAHELTVITFVGDDQMVAGDKAGRLIRFSLASRAPVAAIPAHDLAITGLGVDPSSQQLVTAGADGTIRVWHATTLERLTERQVGARALLSVALAKGGGSVLSGGVDGDVLLWPLDELRPPRPVARHEGPVWAVAFTPDGRNAVSAGADECVRITDLTALPAASEGAASAAPAEASETRKPWLISSHPGAKLYRACAPCHALKPEEIQRSGPHFAGLFGRRAGAVAGYAYSAPLKNAPFSWTEQTLDQLLAQGPADFLPGTNMPLQRLPRAEDRAALIDYLRVLTVGASSSSTPGNEKRRPQK
jgi:cytochrome c